MYDYPGVIPVLVDALKKKGVRFDEASFQNRDIGGLNKHVAILRSDVFKLCDCLFECTPSSIPAHHFAHDASLLFGGSGCSGGIDHNGSRPSIGVPIDAFYCGWFHGITLQLIYAESSAAFNV